MRRNNTAAPHPPYHIRRITSAVSHPPYHIRRITSAVSHPPDHIRRITSARFVVRTLPSTPLNPSHVSRSFPEQNIQRQHRFERESHGAYCGVRLRNRESVRQIRAEILASVERRAGSGGEVGKLAHDQFRRPYVRDRAIEYMSGTQRNNLVIGYGIHHIDHGLQLVLERPHDVLLRSLPRARSPH